MSDGAAAAVALVGVSIPRSGHHFLAALLQHALGEELDYCEYYSAAGCCAQVPCTRRRRRVGYQKNHDLDLTLDPALPGVRYLVQYRDPVPAAVSDRELFAAVAGSGPADDRAEYLVVLSERALHYTRFYAKWVRPAAPQVLAVGYDHLLAEPDAVLAELLRWCGLAVPVARIAAAVAAVAPVRQHPPIVAAPRGDAFTPRVASRSPYFDPELLAAYESLVLESVPELAASRCFPPVDPSDHLLCALFAIRGAALDGRRDEVARLAEEAAQRWPASRHLCLVAGEALRKLGGLGAARPYLEQAAALAPDDGDVLVACANLYVALGEAGRAVRHAARLVELFPANASHRLFLATLQTAAGDPGAALAQALRARELGIAGTHLWRAFGEVLQVARAAGLAVAESPPPAAD